MKGNLNLRRTTAAILSAIGVLLMALSFEPAKPPPNQGGLKLAMQKLNFARPHSASAKGTQHGGNLNINAALPANAPTSLPTLSLDQA